MTHPDPPDAPVVECSDEPKLTAEEWAYIEAAAEGGDD